MKYGERFIFPDDRKDEFNHCWVLTTKCYVCEKCGDQTYTPLTPDKCLVSDNEPWWIIKNIIE